MQIGIIGAGAIGLLFSFYLSKTHRVTVYTRTADQAELINTNGIELVTGEKVENQLVQAKPFEEWTGEEDLAIVTVKQYQLPALFSKFDGTSSLLFLQNGMGHLKYLSKIIARNIFVGTVEHGATRTTQNTVAHNGRGMTKCAVFRGEATVLRELVDSTTDEFSMSLENDYLEILQAKLIVNAIINPLTAAFQVNNGSLVDNPYFYRIVESMFREVSAVLNLQLPERQFANVVSVCENTASNRSSMLKDLEEGRKTEIDAILGYLLEEAESNQVEVPLIRNYYDVIKGKEL
ncbi:2-dehydropantoate 2-reductase [Mesobacillus maritimus]|uniref:2-dehydropantoate 2-reductase n=1 Tax=Mesobacillus maritimus TaxID=1643336 RepID=UPI00203E34C5|nr:2-dehydropantoate 2-reductase [Mesobacillus maritimus]MCM3587083.1 2-dehydropantoate 2-reductase [Mesobacillus maritimus]